MGFKTVLLGGALLSLVLVGLSVFTIYFDDSTIISGDPHNGRNYTDHTYGSSRTSPSKTHKQKDYEGSFSELPTVTLANKLDVDWFQDQINNLASTYIYQPQRWEAHITTDKVIYRPSDVMFIEVLVLDMFNKTPISLNPTDPYMYNMYLSLQIFNSLDVQIHTDNVQIENSTASFTFKIPTDASGGEYYIKVNNYQIPTVRKQFRVRDYIRNQIVVSSEFTLDSYFPGDTVNGEIKIHKADGSGFTSDPQFSFEIHFEGAYSVSEKEQPMTNDGVGYFSFMIPLNTTASVATVGFIVSYNHQQQTHSKTLVIGQPSAMLIEFVPETGVFVLDTMNKIYFQAFTNDAMTDVVDFQNASLVAQHRIRKSQTKVIIDQQVSTLHKGKGVFSFTPEPSLDYYLSIDLGKAGTVKKQVILENSNEGFLPRITKQNPEINFSILNMNKVVGNEEDLVVEFETNANASSKSTFVIQISQKEKILFSEQLQFEPSSKTQMRIDESNFRLVNGGVLQLSLVKIHESANDKDMKNSSVNVQTALISWYEPCGEILFFKQPSEVLTLRIETSKNKYAPGDLVEYIVSVVNKTTNETVEGYDTYVSMWVTDDSVFRKLEDKKQPPSLAAQVYLEHEVLNHDYQFYYANQYIEHMFSEDGATTTDYLNLELLLGVQAWRHQSFDIQTITNLRTQLSSLSEERQHYYSNLYGQEFQIRMSNNTVAWFGVMDEAAEMMPMMAMAANNADGRDDVRFKGAIPPAAMQRGSNEEKSISSKDQQPSGTETSDEQEELTQRDFMINIKPNLRMYSHQLRDKFAPNQRIDMTETVFYSTAQHTTNGKAKGQFYLSDLITKYRVTANAFDKTGKFGYVYSDFQTQKPFYISFDMPSSLTVGDIIDIPVYINNLLDSPLQVDLSTRTPSQQIHSLAISQSTDSVSVGPKSNSVWHLKVNASQISDKESLNVIANAQGPNIQLQDSLMQHTKITPKGFKQILTKGGFIGTQLHQTEIPSNVSLKVSLPDSYEFGSIKINAKIMPSSFTSLLEAVEALIRDPYGCFEQTSSTTYPMVMGLHFLKSMPEKDAKVKKMIMDMEAKLKKGYDKLVTFETKETGYEWFGNTPAHEALSAYGLMQFHEMASSTDFVDQSMLKRVSQWLLSRKDGKGGFLQSDQALDSFGRAPANITNAYIVWALSNTNAADLTMEISHLIKEADASIAAENIDTYFLSLLAASLYNMNRAAEAEKYAEIIANHQLETGNVTRSLTSITSSQGKNLMIETTAIATIAWLNNSPKFGVNIERAINWIVAQVNDGRYGTTQATVLSLKAITKYMNSYVSINGNGTFALHIHGIQFKSIHFSSDTKEPFIFEPHLSVYQNPAIIDSSIPFEVRLQINEFIPKEPTQKDFKLTYAITVEYNALELPSTAVDLAYQVKGKFDRSQLGQTSNIGKPFSYELAVKNRNTDQGQGMTLAVFRVPSCLELNFDLLETLKNNNVFDQYEVRHSNTEIVLYWRQMKRDELKTVQLDFIQKFSGEVCYSKPSNAYLFYNDDQPVWSAIQ